MNCGALIGAPKPPGCPPAFGIPPCGDGTYICCILATIFCPLLPVFGRCYVVFCGYFVAVYSDDFRDILYCQAAICRKFSGKYEPLNWL